MSESSSHSSGNVTGLLNVARLLRRRTIPDTDTSEDKAVTTTSTSATTTINNNTNNSKSKSNRQESEVDDDEIIDEDSSNCDDCNELGGVFSSPSVSTFASCTSTLTPSPSTPSSPLSRLSVASVLSEEGGSVLASHCSGSTVRHRNTTTTAASCTSAFSQAAAAVVGIRRTANTHNSPSTTTTTTTTTTTSNSSPGPIRRKSLTKGTLSTQPASPASHTSQKHNNNPNNTTPPPQESAPKTPPSSHPPPKSTPTPPSSSTTTKPPQSTTNPRSQSPHPRPRPPPPTSALASMFAMSSMSSLLPSVVEGPVHMKHRRKHRMGRFRKVYVVMSVSTGSFAFHEMGHGGGGGGAALLEQEHTTHTTTSNTNNNNNNTSSNTTTTNSASNTTSATDKKGDLFLHLCRGAWDIRTASKDDSMLEISFEKDLAVVPAYASAEAAAAATDDEAAAAFSTTPTDTKPFSNSKHTKTISVATATSTGLTCPNQPPAPMRKILIRCAMSGEDGPRGSSFLAAYSLVKAAHVLSADPSGGILASALSRALPPAGTGGNTGGGATSSTNSKQVLLEKDKQIPTPPRRASIGAATRASTPRNSPRRTNSAPNHAPLVVTNTNNTTPKTLSEPIPARRRVASTGTAAETLTSPPPPPPTVKNMFPKKILHETKKKSVGVKNLGKRFRYPYYRKKKTKRKEMRELFHEEEEDDEDGLGLGMGMGMMGSSTRRLSANSQRARRGSSRRASAANASNSRAMTKRGWAAGLQWNTTMNMGMNMGMQDQDQEDDDDEDELGGLQNGKRPRPPVPLTAKRGSKHLLKNNTNLAVTRGGMALDSSDDEIGQDADDEHDLGMGVGKSTAAAARANRLRIDSLDVTKNANEALKGDELALATFLRRDRSPSNRGSVLSGSESGRSRRSTLKKRRSTIRVEDVLDTDDEDGICGDVDEDDIQSCVRSVRSARSARSRSSQRSSGKMWRRRASTVFRKRSGVEDAIAAAAHSEESSTLHREESWSSINTDSLGSDQDSLASGRPTAAAFAASLSGGGNGAMNKSSGRKRRVKPSRWYPGTHMTEDELFAEMMKPSMEYYEPDTGSQGRSRIGTLKVEVLGCVGLPKFDRFSRNDTNVYLLCGDCAFATDVIPSSRSPLWPCRCRRAVEFPIYHAYARLYVGAFGTNATAKENDYFAGRAVLDVASLRPGSQYDVTLSLRLSAFAYDRRPRGVVRLRFSLEWRNEQLAVLSYLKQPPKSGCCRATRVTIPCADAKTYRNVAVTLHGIDLPGKYSRRAFRATRREFMLYYVQLKALLKRMVKDAITWRYPGLSAYLFVGWMHCVYSNSVALALPYFFGFLCILLVRNYQQYNINEACHGGYAPLTFPELFLSAALGGGKDGKRFMHPISVKNRRTEVASLTEAKMGSERRYTDSSQFDHMEFPFSERQMYPKRSVKESLVPRLRTASITHGNVPSSQVKLLSLHRVAQGEKDFDDDHGSSTDNDTATRDSEFDSSDLDENAEEDAFEATPMPLGVAARGGVVPLGPHQNVDILPKKRMPFKVHLRKFENLLHELTLRMFEENVYCPRHVDGLPAPEKQRQECTGGESVKSIVTRRNPPSNAVALTAVGYLSQLAVHMAPHLIRATVYHVPMTRAYLRVPLRKLEHSVIGPTRRMSMEFARRASFSSRRSSDPMNAALSPDRSSKNGGNKKPKKSVDEFDRRLGLKVQSPNPVSAISADYLGPIMRMMQIGCNTMRVTFNICAWKDPYISFWVLCFFVGLTLFSLLFPWRKFFFAMGLIGLGPQNLLLTIARDKMEVKAAQEKQMAGTPAPAAGESRPRLYSGAVNKTYGAARGGGGDDAESVAAVPARKSSVYRLPAVPKFARNLPGLAGLHKKAEADKRRWSMSSDSNYLQDLHGPTRQAFSSQPKKVVEKYNRRNCKPRDVIVPYTPLKKERLYYWPPDPSASRVSVIEPETPSS